MNVCATRTGLGCFVTPIVQPEKQKKKKTKKKPVTNDENRCGGRGGCVSRLAQLRYS